MPRKVKVSEIQAQRARNYSFFYNERARLKALPVELQDAYAKLRVCLPMPHLTIWGSMDWSDEVYDSMFRLGRSNGLLDQTLLIPFLSDQGWDIFQELWKDLPEPVGFVHVLEDKYGLFHREEEKSVKRK